MKSVKKLLWWILGGSVGGINRGKILECLFAKPYNANELSKVLNLDYKTIRHHLKVLEKNRLITATGSGYGTVYFPSNMLEENCDYFFEIWKKVGEKQKKNFGER
jgi:predicted transcriptional regulator